MNELQRGISQLWLLTEAQRRLDEPSLMALPAEVHQVYKPMTELSPPDMYTRPMNGEAAAPHLDRPRSAQHVPARLSALLYKLPVWLATCSWLKPSRLHRPAGQCVVATGQLGSAQRAQSACPAGSVPQNTLTRRSSSVLQNSSLGDGASKLDERRQFSPAWRASWLLRVRRTRARSRALAWKLLATGASPMDA